MNLELSEQEQFRRESLRSLRAMGIDPYPAALYPTDAFSTDIKQEFKDEDETMRKVCVAGRIMSRRIMGKASFVELQDSKGRIQVYISRDDINSEAQPEMYNTVFKKLLDIGDFIGIKGFVFRTQMGEISVHAQELTVLSKSIKPLPIVKYKDGVAYDSFEDPEQRYRQRYVDLMTNPESRKTFIQRTKIVKELRNFLDSRDFLEVETPMMHPIAGGAAARPFITHHNALDMKLYMRIAPELYLKRLIVGGLERVYELGRVFRNEGIDTRHNPEFTIMEVYQAFGDYKAMMELTEQAIAHVAQAVLGTTKITYQGTEIDLTPPWRRMTMPEAIKKYSGIDFDNIHTVEEARTVAQAIGLEPGKHDGIGKIMNAVFEEVAEAKLIQPTFIIGHPKEISPLAKSNKENPEVTDRFEAFIYGREMANAFSELNDPIDQRERFQKQVQERAEGDDEAHMMDEDFVTALEFGLPPTGGLGIGIDRLVMLLTDSASIRDVLLFPHMRSRE